MDFQLKHTLRSKIFATGPSKLGTVVCQMENQTKSRKTKVIIFSWSVLARKTEPNLKLYGETLKVYPQVKFLGITFDSHLSFKKNNLRTSLQNQVPPFKATSQQKMET